MWYSARCMAQRNFSPALLAAHMERLGVSNRGLGKRVHPENPESARKALLKHLKGTHTPTEANVRRYADALGVPVEEITEEDEESAEMVELLQRFTELRERQAKRSAA